LLLVPPQQGLRSAPSCSQQPAPAVRLLSRLGLGCGFFQPAFPPSPSPLRPLGLRGRKAESPTNTWNSIVSIHNIARQVLDYSTQRVYLLRRSLSDLQLFGDVLACQVARGGAGRLASKLVGGSWIRRTLGTPGC
jgi:hypothetical protein